MNCVQPHPTLPLLATSGIDYDVKLWSPTSELPLFDKDQADVGHTLYKYTFVLYTNPGCDEEERGDAGGDAGHDHGARLPHDQDAGKSQPDQKR